MDRQTNNRQLEKLTWAFGSGELKISRKLKNIVFLVSLVEWFVYTFDKLVALLRQKESGHIRWDLTGIKTEFVTSWCYKSHELAKASLLWGTVDQVSDVAHGPLVL